MRRVPLKNSPFLLTFIMLIGVMWLAMPVQIDAEIYRWVDSEGTYHFHNKQPMWWVQDKLVFLDRRIADKIASLKKQNLPVDSPDFDSEETPGQGIELDEAGKTIAFSSTGHGSPGDVKSGDEEDFADTGRSYQSPDGEGNSPRSAHEMMNLPKGSVIGDDTTHQFHTPDCRLIKRGHGRRTVYLLPLDKFRIFSSPDTAADNGYKPCPVCNGKPR